MIIIDAVDAPRKTDNAFTGPTIRHPDQVTLRSVTASLPDYESSQKEHGGLVEEGRKRKKGRFGSTFWRGAIVAFIVYVVLGLAVGVPIAVTKLRQENKSRPFPIKNAPLMGMWSAVDSSNPLPLQSLRESLYNHDIRCNIWNTAETSPSDSLLLATTRYKLAASGLVTVRSNISYDADFFTGITGSLTVNLNKNVQGEEHDSSMWKSCPPLWKLELGRTSVLPTRTPKTLDADESLSITIELLLPSSSSIDTFLTYLPLFTQQYGDLGRSVSFNRLVIEGTNNMISCGNLSGAQIYVKNVLASIKGTFNVTNKLALDTVRGAITANVTLTQTMSAFQPSFLSMDTGYSPINANVTLSMQKPVEDDGPPSFVTHVKTFNGEINLGIYHAEGTPKSILSLQVQNALAQSNVQLDHKFEGMFNIQTKLDQVTVRNHTATPATSPPKSSISSSSTSLPPFGPYGGPSDRGDPSGRRVRTVQYDTLSTSKAVGWSSLSIPTVLLPICIQVTTLETHTFG
ncbi:hypothetical protein FA13DRAFT_1705247 [Coprinellus micaceus]|uniref:Uncharacterized protein n=1 Tax=Coprinellus micaceus TaxID=71717 RepID=A0A4Y7TVT0_COPMI|nr:hypothetical protein FA13DRAFT_1705247 [Coprinellus micaceus]